MNGAQRSRVVYELPLGPNNPLPMGANNEKSSQSSLSIKHHALPSVWTSENHFEVDRIASIFLAAHPVFSRKTIDSKADQRPICLFFKPLGVLCSSDSRWGFWKKREKMQFKTNIAVLRDIRVDRLFRSSNSNPQRQYTEYAKTLRIGQYLTSEKKPDLEKI